MILAEETATVRIGYTERVITQAKISGSTIKISDHRAEGGEIKEVFAEDALSWRFAPSRVSAPGRLAGSPNFTRLGRMMFVPADVPFETRSFALGAPSLNVMCFFNRHEDNLFTRLRSHWDRTAFDRCLDIRCGKVDLSLQRIANELMHPGFSQHTMLECLLGSLAIDLTRYFKVAPPLVNGGRARKLTNRDLEMIEEFVFSAREGCPTIAGAAELCGMAPTSFRQKYKEATGKSFHAHVEEVRLTRAKSFLINSTMSVKQVGYELGFKHHSAFTRGFRKETGQSPLEYRRSNWQ